MKFFAILTLILGTSSCSENLQTKPASTSDQRIIGEFLRTGSRVFETFQGNHLYPYDGGYRPYFGPVHSPYYSQRPFVDSISPYGYEPGYGYGYSYLPPVRHPPVRYIYRYSSQSPVIYNEIYPVNVHGEHVHKSGSHHHHDQILNSKHYPTSGHLFVHHHHLQNFGLPKNSQNIDNTAEESKIVKKVNIIEPNVVGDSHQKFTDEIVNSERSGELITAIDSTIANKEYVSVNEYQKKNNQNSKKKEISIPIIKPVKIKTNILEENNVSQTNSAEAVQIKKNLNETPVVSSNVPVAVQTLSESESFSNSNLSIDKSSISTVGVSSPVIAVPVEIVSAVPLPTPILVASEQTTSSNSDVKNSDVKNSDVTISDVKNSATQNNESIKQV